MKLPYWVIESVEALVPDEYVGDIIISCRKGISRVRTRETKEQWTKKDWRQRRMTRIDICHKDD